MKTDIAIPRSILEAAESLAKTQGISLSELYATALHEYVSSHALGDITQMLDRVYGKESSALEPVIVNLQILSLGDETW
jgi:hypothetical protein